MATIQKNKSHKHRYGPNSNPQPGDSQCSALTTLPSEYPQAWKKISNGIKNRTEKGKSINRYVYI